jgi:hypothetical protein
MMQALGRLAAMEWLHGSVPWWNPYSGVGMPLAAEFHPSAFFPATFLLLLPNGVVWRRLLLQLLAGFGTYSFLRQLGLTRLAALAGGLLCALSGALSWFGDTAAGVPLVFLPWVLLGVDRATIKASLRRAGGWRLLGAAAGMMLLGGFPETAYICGLFALAWAALRLVQCEPSYRWGVAWRIGLGGGVGLALAARNFWRLRNCCLRLTLAAMLVVFSAPWHWSRMPLYRACSPHTFMGRSGLLVWS